MRYLTAILFLWTNWSFGQINFFHAADAFFKKNVVEGQVKYADIQKNPADLNELIYYIADHNHEGEDNKAYLINVYNLCVINKVVQNYPINSPMEVTRFFDDKDITLGGEMTSLNAIENEMLRPTYNDARLHFALVCGAVGCPKIRDEAYVFEKLEKQLDDQADRALNDTKFVYQDSRQEKIYLSEIFTWYREDFGKNKKQIIEYINQYRQAFPFDINYSVEYYPYDWTLNDWKAPDLKTPIAPSDSPKDTFNIQTFTAGSLLGKNKWDFTLFNTLYTQTKSNWTGQDLTGPRETFVTHLFQFTYGITKSKRVNVGLDFNLRNSGRSMDLSAKGIGTAFQYANTDSSRFGLTSIGARVKVQPFKKVGNFSIQSTVYIPTIPNPEGTSNLYWADWDRVIWWNQFFFDKTWNKFQLFLEADLWFRFGWRQGQYSHVDVPLNVFFSYFPTKKITIYVMSQHVPRFTYNIDQPVPDTDWVIPMNYTASGIGFKYNLVPGLNLELLYTNFWRGKNSGLGETYNLGIKYILN